MILALGGAQLLVPDPIGDFFLREHLHPNGFDLHPEYRPWAQRHYYRIYGFAPLVSIAPAPNPATKLTTINAPLSIAPQVPEIGGG